jgi:cardiolipin synthase
MVTPYFVPDDPIVTALSIQAKTGRDVRLIVPRHSNHLIPDFARGPYLRRLIEAGARVYAFPRMVHAKVLLFDDNIAVTGSPNLDMRSMYLNYEIALFHYSRSEIERTEHWMGQLIDESEQLRYEPVGIVKEWAENLSIMVSPLL